jgi:CMP-N,N'-diacetyllegionaminic acid synthase
MELAQDDTPSLDVIHHMLENYILDVDAIALIPCTNPLKTAEDIDAAIQMLEDNPMAESVIGVGPAEPPERIKKIDGGLLFDTFPEPADGQRQFLPKYWVRNGSIYVVRRNSLDKLFGHEYSLPYCMSAEKSINIDDPLDWKIAEMLLKEREGIA